VKRVLVLAAALVVPMLAGPAAAQLVDPLRSQQYGLETVHVPEAWDIATGEEVRVAVIDSGVDRAHADLALQVAQGEGETVAEPTGTYQTLPVGPWNTTQDTDGHGTLVSGIVAAQRGNGVGIAGVSDATIVPVKMIAFGGLETVDDVAEAMHVALDANADVLQMSVSTRDTSPALDAALARAEAEDAVVVASAGNTGGDEPRWPANAGTAIAVGAVDEETAVWENSNRDPSVVAPGVDVFSSWLGNTYREATGTSFSTPFVSGTAALMLDACPSLSPAQVRESVNATAEDLGGEGYDEGSGWGLLRADRATQQAAKLC